MENVDSDSVWVLACTALAFLMQAGFLCLESGITRSKNSINVAIKNLTDFTVSLLLFWLFGYGVMFGASQAGWFGWGSFCPALGQGPSGGIILPVQCDVLRDSCDDCIWCRCRADEILSLSHGRHCCLRPHLSTRWTLGVV